MYRRATVVLLLAALAVGLGAAPAAADDGGPSVYEGTISGAAYRAEVPHEWNGTLVLWSHAAYRFGFSPPQTELTNQPITKRWLLDHGYAVAASRYQPVSGWVVKQGLDDQIALLDWFDRTVGKPRHTVAEGASMGGLVATLLAERNPGRFDGVVALCGDQAGSVAAWNLGLDFSFVIKTLLDPASDLQLVHISDPDANRTAAINLVLNSMGSAQGRARLALAGAIADMPPWSSPTQPQPVDLDTQLSQQGQAGYYGILLSFLVGVDRAALEHLAGGNPTWNVGVDYRSQLSRSSQRDLAERAYQAAGLDLDADLDRLASTARVAPDPSALAYQALYGTPRGTTRAPVLTVHTTGDGLTPPEHQRQYANQVNVHGDPGQLRQLYVPRGGHCTFTASEEIVALRTMFTRIDTGTWATTDPATLTTEAAMFGPEYQSVHLTNDQYAQVTPAFVAYAPALYPRPFPC
jgi:pimeloyl-ACP methyl ester carboxylesterase